MWEEEPIIFWFSLGFLHFLHINTINKIQFGLAVPQFKYTIRASFPSFHFSLPLLYLAIFLSLSLLCTLSHEPFLSSTCPLFTHSLPSFHFIFSYPSCPHFLVCPQFTCPIPWFSLLTPFSCLYTVSVAHSPLPVRYIKSTSKEAYSKLLYLQIMIHFHPNAYLRPQKMFNKKGQLENYEVVQLLAN